MSPMTFARISLQSAVLSALLTLAPIAQAADLPTPAKSLEKEFGYLIGDWKCRITEAGKPDTQSSVKFEWLYDKKTLKETVTTQDYSGQFFTTLDRRSNSFKGVAIDNQGGYIIWENPGMQDNKASEVGYFFGAGKLTPVSRSDSEKVSDTHYIIRDFTADTPAGKGMPTDTEDCTKIS